MLHLLELDQYPILSQLKLEEALLRTDHKNWCLINRGSSPAIVMGISQKPELVVDFPRHKYLPIPLIRRYSGGGTVVVEPTTVFLTLILNHNLIDAPPFPKDVLKWTEALLKPAFQGKSFSLQENDYAIGVKKCGGNAQYFAKSRIVHHTSFVFDYSKNHMELLKLPPQMPSYRQGRSHLDFLDPLKNHFPSPKAFSNALLFALSKKFPLKKVSLSEIDASIPHRKATIIL